MIQLILRHKICKIQAVYKNYLNTHLFLNTLQLNYVAMYIKELLLNGKAFVALLKEVAIEAKDIIIKDESTLIAEVENSKNEILKEAVCIEGKNENGLFNLFGILHFNLLNNLAVFEIQSLEKVVAKA